MTGLMGLLFAVGDKLKIVQVAPAKSAENSTPGPARITTRTVKLSDLVTEIQAAEVKALAERPDDLSIPFERMFEAAGVKPAGHGWTVEKLRDLLRGEPYKSMDRAAAQKALIEKLATEKVSQEDLVKDALARDQALDTFEETTRAKMRERAEARKRKSAELHAQIEALQKECGRLEQEGKTELHQWHQWHGRKVDFEKEMAWAIGYLLDRPVVSVDEEGP